MTDDPAAELPPGALRADLSDLWGTAGRDVVRALPRGERRPFGDALLALLTERLPPSPPPPGLLPPRRGDLSRYRRRLLAGTAAARLLLVHGVTDPGVLLLAVLFPWYDRDLDGTRPRTLALAAPNEPAGTGGRDGLAWARAALLALSPPEARHGATPLDHRSAHLRHLAGLPAPLRLVPLAVHHAASGMPEYTWEREPARIRFRPAEVAALSGGLPAPLVAELRAPAPPPAPSAVRRGHEPSLDRGIVPPSVRPLGSADEAIREVLSHSSTAPAGLRLLATGRELEYLVRWDATADEVHRRRPPLLTAGGPPQRFREPGWSVDRVTRATAEIDLAYVHDPLPARRTVPLPPGWPGAVDPATGRALRTRRGALPPDHGGSLVEGLRREAKSVLPGAASSPLRDVIDGACRTYAAHLATDDWPDFVLAWRTGLAAARSLLAAAQGAPAGPAGAGGPAGPVAVAAVLLAARDPAGVVGLVGDGTVPGGGEVGELARVAVPPYPEPDLERATARYAELVRERPADVRAVVVAGALGRAVVETEVFGVLPAARRTELRGLRPLTEDLPGLAAQVSQVLAG